MGNERFKYTKDQVVRFLLAFSLVLSLFSVSGTVRVSSFQIQKYTTEFLWSKNYKDSSVGAGYYILAKSPVREVNDFQRKGYELGIRLMYDRIVNLKIGHLTSQFDNIKSILLLEYGFESLISHQDILPLSN